MKNSMQWGMLAVLGLILVTATGCASSRKNKNYQALQNQIGVLTDEVVRIDQELQDVRGSMYQFENTRGISGAAVAIGTPATSAGSGPVYRTPSGFELPAKSIQEALRNAGYYQGPIDGKVGSGTKSAISSFQRDHSLTADGVVGRRTWDKLKVYLSGAIK